MKSVKATAAVLVSVALGSALFFATVPSQAKDAREKCQHHIQKAEIKLDQAIRRHGERSHEAMDRRHELNTERERCWNEFHSWWNGHESRWHTDRDWDRF